MFLRFGLLVLFPVERVAVSYHLDESISTLIVRGRYHMGAPWHGFGGVCGKRASSQLELYKGGATGKGVVMVAETPVRKVSK